MSKKKCKEIVKTNNNSILITVCIIGVLFVLFFVLAIFYALVNPNPDSKENNKWHGINFNWSWKFFLGCAIFILVVFLVVFFVAFSYRNTIMIDSDEYKKLKCKKVLKKDLEDE